METKKCPHSPPIDSDEAESLNWLIRTLENIAKSEGHRNSDNAMRAVSAIGKIITVSHDLHDRVHQLEDEADVLRAECHMTRVQLAGWRMAFDTSGGDA